MALGAPNLPKRCQRAPLAACRPANARKRAQDGPCPPNQTGGPLCCHPGGLGFAQLWPKFEVAAPPRAVPRPRGVAHGHFFWVGARPCRRQQGRFLPPRGLGNAIFEGAAEKSGLQPPGGRRCLPGAPATRGAKPPPGPRVGVSALWPLVGGLKKLGVFF